MEDYQEKLSELGPLEKSNKEIPVYDCERQRIYPYHVKQRLNVFYGSGGRELITHPMLAGYDSINAIAFALKGTPPKGHAMYYAGNGGHLWFYNFRGELFEEWQNVVMELETG